MPFDRCFSLVFPSPATALAASFAALALAAAGMAASTTAPPPQPAPAGERAQDEDPLAVAVLEQGGRRYSARDVLNASSERDRSLLETLERDPSYREIYLASPNFLRRVQAFSDWLLVRNLELPDPSEEQLLAEAAAWARDHGQKTTALGALVSHPLEIDYRARLIAEQPQEFPTTDLRDHLYRSVPEFFGELACSWIRVPLVDPKTGHAKTVGERRVLYDELDGLARALELGEQEWDEAAERYALTPAEGKRKGYIGLVSRRMAGRYEEPLLRHIFDGLGVRKPTGALLRGPIVGDRWMYLVRIESVRTRGVVDLEQARVRVTRSLRESMIQQKLTDLRGASARTLLAPILPGADPQD